MIDQERLSEQAKRWTGGIEQAREELRGQGWLDPKQARSLARQLTEAQEQLQRLLVLNDYGYEIGFHSEGPRPGKNGEPFLSDEWLEKWYGKDWAPDYVHEELEKVGKNENSE